MNRARFYNIAFHDHIFFNPLSPAKVDRVLALLDLTPGQRVLDVGCGNAEFLLRLIERFQVAGVGVDPDAETLALAWIRAAQRIPPALSPSTR